MVLVSTTENQLNAWKMKVAADPLVEVLTPKHEDYSFGVSRQAANEAHAPVCGPASDVVVCQGSR